MENKIILSPRFFKVIKVNRRRLSLQNDTNNIIERRKGNSVRIER